MSNRLKRDEPEIALAHVRLITLACAIPWKPKIAISDLEREKHQLQMKLLQANSALRLKVLYAEQLEHLVCDRNKRVDSLYAQLQLAWQRNQKLEQEAEHLTQLIANSGQTLLAADHDAANEARFPKLPASPR